MSTATNTAAPAETSPASTQSPGSPLPADDIEALGRIISEAHIKHLSDPGTSKPIIAAYHYGVMDGLLMAKNFLVSRRAEVVENTASIDGTQ